MQIDESPDFWVLETIHYIEFSDTSGRPGKMPGTALVATCLCDAGGVWLGCVQLGLEQCCGAGACVELSLQRAQDRDRFGIAESADHLKLDARAEQVTAESQLAQKQHSGGLRLGQPCAVADCASEPAGLVVEPVTIGKSQCAHRDRCIVRNSDPASESRVNEILLPGRQYRHIEFHRHCRRLP
jgi:hypothetical protein